MAEGIRDLLTLPTNDEEWLISHKVLPPQQMESYMIAQAMRKVRADAGITRPDRFIAQGSATTPHREPLS